MAGPAGGLLEAMNDNRTGVVVIGCATTVAMWALGYLARMPPVLVSPVLLGVAMLVCLIAGGFVAGRFVSGGWRAGAGAGLVASVLNSLVLGSLLTGDHPNQIVPSALWWIPGSLLVGAVLGGVGGVIGGRSSRPVAGEGNWSFAFACTAATATFLQLVVGGLVTSHGAGLAVVDWPNSFGYNMFLYPLSRMTGGVYFEHAHRLFGSLVGLQTLALAIHLQTADPRRWVRRAGWFALVAVIVQGVLGGLRVTGHLTLSTLPADTAPSITLAIVHGVGGLLFLGLMAAIAAWVSTAWQTPQRAGSSPAIAGTDIVMARVLAGLLLVQLLLGAVQRHLDSGLMIHVTFATAVLVVAVLAGARTLGLYRRFAPLASTARALLIVVGLQMLLGFGAMAAVIGRDLAPADAPWQVLVRTAHHGTGALLVAVVALLLVWTHRILETGNAANGETEC